MQESQELQRIVERMYAAMTEADATWAREAVSDSEATLLIGSDPAEWWEGAATVRRKWAAQLEAGLGGAKLEPRRLRAYQEGDIGWASDQPRMALPDGNEVSARITAVFRRESGDWKMVQAHFSIGVPNEDAIGMELPT